MQIRVHIVCVIILLFMCINYTALAGEKILIAAASDLSFAMNEICAAFERENPYVDVEVAYGSSGNFFMQIKQGAPYDLFFSADGYYPALLEKEGFAVKNSSQKYAIGMIVLWMPKKLSLDSNRGLDIVLDSRIKKLAIANPRHAPYGCAAEESLRYYGLWDKVHGKLVFGENVSQTAQFAQAGAANAAIIALSIALSPDLKKMGNYWIIPTESYKKLDQVYTVLHRGEHKSGVKTFLRFLDGEKSKRIFSNYGFILPQNK